MWLTVHVLLAVELIAKGANSSIQGLLGGRKVGWMSVGDLKRDRRMDGSLWGHEERWMDVPLRVPRWLHRLNC